MGVKLVYDQGELQVGYATNSATGVMYLPLQSLDSASLWEIEIPSPEYYGKVEGCTLHVNYINVYLHTYSLVNGKFTHRVSVTKSSPHSMIVCGNKVSYTSLELRDNSIFPSPITLEVNECIPQLLRYCSQIDYSRVQRLKVVGSGIQVLRLLPVKLVYLEYLEVDGSILISDIFSKLELERVGTLYCTDTMRGLNYTPLREVKRVIANSILSPESLSEVRIQELILAKVPTVLPRLVREVWLRTRSPEIMLPKVSNKLTLHCYGTEVYLQPI